MLFLKPKPKADELLPPPPPFPSLELEESQDNAQSPVSKDFEDLLKDLEDNQKPEAGKDELKLKRLSKKEIGKLKMKSKQLKEKKQKLKAETDYISDLNSDLKSALEFDDFDRDGKKSEFPCLADEFSNFGQEAKNLNTSEDEKEIENAIQSAKTKEKRPLFGLFRKKIHVKEEPVPELKANGITEIHNMIEKARNSLMNFDLKSARECYVDIIEVYSKLGNEEKAKVYWEIKELYYERKTAEELKI